MTSEMSIPSMPVLRRHCERNDDAGRDDAEVDFPAYSERNNDAANAYSA